MLIVTGTFSRYKALANGRHQVHLEVVDSNTKEVLHSETTVSNTERQVTRDALAKWNKAYPKVDVRFHERIVPDSELESLESNMDVFGL